MIWKRYMLKSCLKFMLFFLLSIFALFSLIDFFSHSTRMFTYNQISLFSVFLYYLYQFILLLPIFLPLSFLLSLISVLCDMNMHKEIVSLQMAGISFYKLVRPFFVLSFFLSSLLILNYQFFTPIASSYTSHFKENNLKKKKKEVSLHSHTLKDGSKLIFQKKLSQDLLFDLYWIKKDQLYHMKTLDLTNNPPIGHQVDLFEKKENLISKKSSFDQYLFEKIPFSAYLLQKGSIESSSLTQLFMFLLDEKMISRKEKVKILSQLFNKLFMPLLPFLIVFAIAPYCIRFSKNISVFTIIVFSLTGFFVFYTLMDSILILSENHVIHPFLANGSLFFLVFLIFGRKFFKEFYQNKIVKAIRLKLSHH